MADGGEGRGEADALAVYSDYVCPFCYLGRRSLERYRATRDEPLAVDWQPFDLRSRRRGPDGRLDPDADDGKGEAYYERARENVRRLAERYGVEMRREIATDVDSLPAMAASFRVREARPDRWPAFDEAVFEALWVDGRDVGDVEVLTALAGDVGLDGETVAGAVADGALRERVLERCREASRRGVTGVPTFVYGGRAARGAVPPEQLRRLVEGAGRDGPPDGR